MVHDEINVARTPKHVFIDRLMHHVSEGLRKIGLHRFVHAIRKSGLPNLVRSMNTKSRERGLHTKTYDQAKLATYFKDDVEKLSVRIGRDMSTEWLEHISS